MGKYVHISKQIHTHTYIKLSHFAVYLKLALHCQLTVLQLKKQLQKLKGEVPWWSRWLGLGPVISKDTGLTPAWEIDSTTCAVRPPGEKKIVKSCTFVLL